MSTKQLFSTENILPHFPFIKTFRKYNKVKFKADIIAGLTVGIVALPQSMAYAIIAGIHPKYGLYAAIVPTIISSLFSSSKFLIAGPTNAISMVIFSTFASLTIGGAAVSGLPESEKISILFLLAFLIGAMQLIMGFVRVGSLINFISHSVIIGFTAGAGFLIACNQLKNFLGLSLPASHSFVETAGNLFSKISFLNWPSVVIGAFTIIFIVILKKYLPKWPGPFMAMLLSALAAAFFGLDQAGLKLIGEIPRSLPPISSFPFDLEKIKALLSPALAIAILGIVEALSIAKSIANTSGEKIRGSQEFISQGLSNISAAFFSSIPGSGSFTRSAVNYKAGAKSRMSGIYSSIVVLLTIVLFAPYARFIPIASLAGILMVVAYSMVDKKGFALSFRSTLTDRIVLISTMLCTVFFELETAIYFGVFMSIILFLRKVSHPHIIEVYPRVEDNILVTLHAESKICRQISIFEIEGSLFFGAVSELEEKLRSMKRKGIKVIILRLRGVRIIDATGVNAIEKFLQECKAENISLIFSGLRPSVIKVLENSGVRRGIEDENIQPHTTAAIEFAFKKYVDKHICDQCHGGVFKECRQYLN